MRVLFHIPTETLKTALEYYDKVSNGDEAGLEGLDEVMETLRLVLDGAKIPLPNPQWPVSYESACDVVSALHDQLDDAQTEICKLEEQFFKLQKELFDLTRAPDNNGERKVERCPDCGEEGETMGHQTCQYPGRAGGMD